MNNQPSSSGSAWSPFVVTHNSRFSKKIRLVDTDGSFKDDYDTYIAINTAKNMSLDLICIEKGDFQKLPLCKMMNFGKWKYEQEKKKKEQDKNGRKSIKEMKFTPDIAEHDITYKVKKINEFLSDGDDVMLIMTMRGRQILHFREAEEKMNKIVSLCICGKEDSRKKAEKFITIRLSKCKAE